ncbi:helix-turn-helix transcriptional regulator [Labrenzia sp. R4_2]|uniref:TetR/AcrR family transcriptional regulator n=1 Tax=Labrenzia sp. R4_2 TaxID=2821107 RepID=UPI001ADC699A|nr:TetR/AcrR family transcriptional regulator [Labrenzia sp. R4_2]MBO9420907.1 helix-turn-helix transcriptional regulator [Labrenzia sp. R4_2]
MNAAVEVLIELGLSKTTTLEVQKRAGVSRGAFLHHFPTHAGLLSMTISRLIELNENAVWSEAEKLKDIADPLTRSVRTLANAYAHPSFVAELELWIAARADPALRTALRSVEQDAITDRDRVLTQLFKGLLDQPGAEKAIGLTIEFIRGLTISSLLRNDQTLRNRLIEDWIETLRNLLAANRTWPVRPKTK